MSLFKKNRISVFAASNYTNERAYLLWFDNITEPELWVYDVNGFSRFENLEKYLDSYLEDNIENSYEWILGNIEN